MIKNGGDLLKKTNLYFSIIITLITFFYIAINEKYVSFYLIYSGIIGIILLIIEVVKNILESNNRIFTFLQLLISIVTIYYNFPISIYLIPMYLFELIGFIVPSLAFILINFGITYFLYKTNYFENIIYITIITFYLYKCSNQEKSIKELKFKNKNTREEVFKKQEDIKNLNKLLNQSEINMSLKERNLMSQKLHDHLGHRITSSIMQLEVTKEMLNSDMELSKKYLCSAMDNLRSGMEEIRDFLRKAKPNERVISIETIKKDIYEFQYRTKIKVNLNFEGDVQKLNYKALSIINTNINECLINVCKHSMGNSVNISFNIYNKFCRIDILDNGDGAIKIVKGLGLTGIEERLKSIGGKAIFSSNDGFKTTMIINY